jgi:K+-transporting ATPase ATPase A chain
VDGVSFGVLLTGTLIIVGVLSFLPALCLGPLIEHLLGLKGVFF